MYNLYVDGCMYNLYVDGCIYNLYVDGCMYNLYVDGCMYNLFVDGCIYSLYVDGCIYSLYVDAIVMLARASKTKIPSALIFRVRLFERCSLVDSLTLKMRTLRSFETSVTLYQSTRCHITEVFS
jgi:hypothetical protein